MAKTLVKQVSPNKSLAEFGGSLGDQIDLVKSAFNKQYSDYWVQDVFPSHIIVRSGRFYDYEEKADKSMYKVTYTTTGKEFTFADIKLWQSVKIDYVRELVQTQFVSELKNDSTIDVPIRKDVDLIALTKGDDNPFFLTMEIGRNDVISGNNLLYDNTLLQSIVSQINERPIEGIMGHLHSDQRSTSFPVPDIHWLGATQIGETIYGKGYIPKTAEHQREYFRVLEATGGKAATSIYGWADAELIDANKGTWRAREFTLEQLDLAPYTRAALAPNSKHYITAELTQNNSQIEELIISEIEEETQMGEEVTNVAETKVNISEFEMLKKRVQEFEVAEFKRGVGQIVTETINWNVQTDEGKAAVNSLRFFIAEYAVNLSENNSLEDAKKLIAKAITDLEPVTIALTRQLSGPPAQVSEQTKGRTKLDDSPEARQKALSDLGLGGW